MMDKQGLYVKIAQLKRSISKKFLSPSYIKFYTARIDELKKEIEETK